MGYICELCFLKCFWESKIDYWQILSYHNLSYNSYLLIMTVELTSHLKYAKLMVWTKTLHLSQPQQADEVWGMNEKVNY